MIMTAIANETFMNYELIYKTDQELSNILMELRDFARTGHCKQYEVFPGNVRDDYKGSVFACLRCNAVDTLYYRLKHNNHVKREINTVYDDYITIDEPF